MKVNSALNANITGSMINSVSESSTRAEPLLVDEAADLVDLAMSCAICADGLRSKKSICKSSSRSKIYLRQPRVDARR